jgi:hypothetical protein
LGNLAAFIDYGRKFLRLADWVVEGVGFEPRSGFCDAKLRHVRRLQMAGSYQRILHHNPRLELYN